MAKVKCPNCPTLAQVKDENLGKPVKCPKCGTAYVAEEYRPAAPEKVAPPPPPKKTTTMPPPVPAKPAAAIFPAEARPVATGVGAAWVLAAVAALLLPLLAAGGYVMAERRKPQLFAGIEIGAGGPRYCVIEFLPAVADGPNYRFPHSAASQVKVTEGLKDKGEFKKENLARLAESVKMFRDQIVKDHRVAADRIVVTAADGLYNDIAGRNDIDDQEKVRLIGKARAALSRAVGEATGLAVESVSQRHLAGHQVKAAVPRAMRKEAVYLDIGSGGTRGGYADPAGLTQDVRGPGLNDLRAAAEDGLDGQPFAPRAKLLAEDALRVPLRATLAKDGEFTARHKVYLCGGSAWALATWCRADEEGDYVKLTPMDIKRFAAKVHEKPEMLLAPVEPDNVPSGRREWWRDEIAKVRQAFPPDRLVCAAEILEALCDELKFEGREVMFYKPADYAWIASYIDETRRQPK